MNADYFKKIFQSCISIYGKVMQEETASFIRYDSTIVALSTQLLKAGYLIKGGDAEHVRLLKFTIGFSQLPQSAHFYTEQQYGSENIALKEYILAHQPIQMPFGHSTEDLTHEKLLMSSSKRKFHFI